jgi:Transketolase, N-terminal subunit
MKLDERSKNLRSLAIDALEGGGRGHIGSTMSLIEILRVLFDSVMVYDPLKPTLEFRDRLILSKGHGVIALYALLVDKGFFPADNLPTFCRFDSILGGHPERSHVPGVEATTGSLGHGLSVGVGMAFAARVIGRPNRVFVVLGDGELNEGSVWEAALAAGHHKLKNLTVIVDYNGFQSYGRIEEIWRLEPLRAKWEAFGFDTCEVDGHSLVELEEAFKVGGLSDRPRVVVARTVKGRGISFAENQPSWHHKVKLTPSDISAMRQAVMDA